MIKKKATPPKEKKTASPRPSKKTGAVKAVPVVPVVKEEEKAKPLPKAGKFIAAVGRRKQAVARVRLSEGGQGRILINGQELKKYFPIFQLWEMAQAPLKLVGMREKCDLSVKVAGGGKQGQAEATRHGVSRVLIKLNPDLKPALKKAGFLTRDPRVKERKKFGLKKARRAPQWAKR